MKTCGAVGCTRALVDSRWCFVHAELNNPGPSKAAALLAAAAALVILVAAAYITGWWAR